MEAPQKSKIMDSPRQSRNHQKISTKRMNQCMAILLSVDTDFEPHEFYSCIGRAET
jgi:hypothetical protein